MIVISLGVATFVDTLFALQNILKTPTFDLMIEISARQAIQKARREFKDLSEREMSVGISRAINHTLGVSRTQASRLIRNEYKISAKIIRKTFAIKKAFARQSMQTGTLSSSGGALPLYAFGARQTKRGVSVNVKGTRKVVRQAFIATMKSGHLGVFGRGLYKGGEFAFRTKRLRRTGADLPITELKSISVPRAMAQNAVVKALSASIAQRFPLRLTHELMRIRSASESEG